MNTEQEPLLRDDAPAEPATTELVADWLSSVSGRVRASARLVMAETKLAVTTFLLMIFLIILSAGAVMFAWCMLMLAAAQGLMALGLPSLGAIGILFVLHGGIAYGLWRWANALSKHMEFRATRELLGSHDEQ